MKHTVKLLSLALCAALVLSLPALAAEGAAEEPPAREIPAPVRVWGTVTKLPSGSLELKNSNQNDPYSHIIVHLADTTPCVDAVTGVPVDMADVKDGATVYAWVGPAMTMSLPPQSAALVVVANLPADYAAPQYYQVVGEDRTVMPAIYPPPARTEVNLPVAGGETLTVPVSAEIKPYRTNNRVMVDDLTPGSHFLAWRENGAISRIVLLPNRYEGYCTVNAGGEVFVNGEKLAVPARVDGPRLLPVRAVAEAMGYDVSWEKGLGAVVKNGERTLFTVLPGGEVARRDEAGGGDWDLTSPCVLEKGVTYLAANDLALLLGLYLYA